LKIVDGAPSPGNSQPVDSLQLSAVRCVPILGVFQQKRRRRRSAASRKTAADQKKDGFLAEVTRRQFFGSFLQNFPVPFSQWGKSPFSVRMQISFGDLWGVPGLALAWGHDLCGSRGRSSEIAPRERRSQRCRRRSSVQQQDTELNCTQRQPQSTQVKCALLPICTCLLLSAPLNRRIALRASARKVPGPKFAAANLRGYFQKESGN
jgi:hypothetical protein